MTVPTWPLRTAADGRHLEDADGVPFRANIDAAWFASTEFWLADDDSAADFERYLADRAAKGFTAFLLMGMVQVGYNQGYLKIETGAYAHLPSNRVSGEPPLLRPDDFSTPNPAYWANIRAIVAAAERHGLAVVLAYNYLGYAGGLEGWWQAISGPENSVEGMRGFGHWLAADLLRDQHNVIWYPYGDHNPPPGEGSRRVRATIEAIRAVRPDDVVAAELISPDDVIGDNADADELLTVNSFYGFGPDADGRVWVTAEEAWSSAPTRPCWTCEPQYEGAGIGGTGVVDDVREAEYWSVLGGGTAGQVYGSVGVYNFAAGEASPTGHWHDLLQSPGAVQQAHQFALWASLDWWALVPSGADDAHYGLDLVTAGQGDGHDHIAAAGTPDGRWIVAYLPLAGARAFSIDASRMRGPVTAEWFDPTTGERAVIRSADPGVLDLEAPAANASGATDWVLVLSAV